MPLSTYNTSIGTTTTSILITTRSTSRSFTTSVEKSSAVTSFVTTTYVPITLPSSMRSSTGLTSHSSLTTTPMSSLLPTTASTMASENSIELETSPSMTPSATTKGTIYMPSSITSTMGDSLKTTSVGFSITTYRLHYLSDTTTDSSNGKRSDSTDPSYITITYTPLSTSTNASQSVATASVGSIISLFPVQNIYIKVYHVNCAKDAGYAKYQLRDDNITVQLNKHAITFTKGTNYSSGISTIINQF
uniref:Uncharacterized protein n=1 Tax=Romanomermis culicivorax TaxID=13658 RepID=A0A915J4K8_ROMCU